MALITCPNCGSEISDRAAACPKCGEPVVREEASSPEPQPMLCEECGAELPEGAQACPKCGCPVAPPEAPAVPAAKPEQASKKKLILAAALGGAALIVAIIVAIVLVVSRPGKVIENARQLADDGDYAQAVEMLTDLDKPEKTQSLLEDIYEKMEDEVHALMDKGEYIKAQKLLNDYSALPSHDQLRDEIKYESFALACLYDLRPYMKNPNSLQANTIEFYKSTDGDPYPSVVICESGQNGFGGYSISYILFDSEDLTVYGSCDSLDEDSYDLEDDDDFLEWFVASMINDLTDQLPASFSLNRINSLLSGNITPNIDISQYADADASATT